MPLDDELFPNRDLTESQLLISVIAILSLS